MGGKPLKSLREQEDHRARICLDMILEFLHQRPDYSMGKCNMSTRDYTLEQFQKWIGKKIKSPNENEEYVKYRKKYREIKKNNLSKQ